MAQVLVGSSEERILAARPQPAQHLGHPRRARQEERPRLDRPARPPGVPGKVRRVQRAAAHARRLAGAPRRSDAAALEAGQAEVEARIAGRRVESWEGVDRELFERLRAYRRRQADERGVPPYVVFSDATLRDLARLGPPTHDELLTIHGIGAKKCAEYGDDLLREIAEFSSSANNSSA